MSAFRSHFVDWGEEMDKDTIVKFNPPSSEELASELYVTWVGKRKWGPEQSIGFQTLNIHVIVYVVSGKGTVTQGGNEAVKLEQGSVFFIFPGTRFRFRADADEPWEFYWAAFGGSKCEGLLSQIGVNQKRFVVEGIQQEARWAMETLLEHLNDVETDRLAVLGGLLVLLSQVGRRTEKKKQKSVNRQDIVPRTVRFIEMYYYLHLDVDMLCNYVQYSRSYLSRLFNNELGVTIPEYINQVRVRHAKELFEQTTLSVQEVSASVGIVDSFYFSKTFKKLVGISPNQYKKQFGLNAQQMRAE